jgi:hypothetical protein
LIFEVISFASALRAHCHGSNPALRPKLCWLPDKTVRERLASMRLANGDRFIPSGAGGSAKADMYNDLKLSIK